ncbi:MAG: ABC transporter permease [Clostridium sp.]|uniref:ABC transporter permease n=1 Tax=Clostridium sp. TaxID=1506 RepID=UPI002FCB68CF
MSDILNLIFSTEFAYSVIRVTTPILFAALAALISNKAGVVNIGIEGIMLMSALVGVIGSAFTQSAFLGVVFAMAAGALMALVLAYFALNLKTDIILGGIALNLFATGGTVFLLYVVSGDRGASTSLSSLTVPQITIPLIDQIPVIGPILSGHNLLTYLSVIMVVVVSYFLYKTPTGLKIRAVGEAPHAASSVGISVRGVQYKALIISGLLSGLAGAYMSMGYLSMFSNNMTAGRGFIALAAEAMGRGTPIGTFIASLVFGFADALSSTLQVLSIPVEFIQMIPYLTTIIGLVVYSASRAKKANKLK